MADNKRPKLPSGVSPNGVFSSPRLTGNKVSYRYEAKEDVIKYVKPARVSRYIPDFVLRHGTIIETKGRFVMAERQKHLLIKDQHPDLDIRFVFSNPNQRISKQSKVTYAMWCRKHGFQYCSFKDKATILSWCQAVPDAA